MAQSNFDRRRINGPDESYQPIFESDDEQETRWKAGGGAPRKGRAARDIRPICMPTSSQLWASPDETRKDLKAGLINQANGSAYIETEKTKIACAVYGPRQSKTTVYNEKGRLNVEVKFTPFSCTKRRVPIRDAEDRSVAVQIQQALASAVRLELLPKSTLDIFVTVIENDGIEGCIAAGSVAASVALADAGIEMLGLVASCSAAVVGEEIWMDPTEEDSKLASGSVVLASLPALGTITSVWQSGSMAPDEAIKSAGSRAWFWATLAGSKDSLSCCDVAEDSEEGSVDAPAEDSDEEWEDPEWYAWLKTWVEDVWEATHKEDSDDSLRDLELSDGPLLAETTRPLRPRSYSVSGFDFQHDLLPLSASLSEPDQIHPESHEKRLGLVNANAFGLTRHNSSSPGVVIANTQSVGASLLVWFAAGVLGWTGASSFAELGSSIPVNGGAQAYLQYAYGPLVSYLFAWTAISALKPGGNAVISLIFAEYLNRLFWHSTRAEVSPDDIPVWATKLTAVGAVVVVSIICVATPTLGTRAAVVFTTVKVSITVLGLVQLARGRASTSFTEPLFEHSSTSPSAYALALYSGLWAFDGWDQANYVGGEMKNPEKNIPRAIHSSMVVVMILFILANVAYFTVLDKNTVGLSNTVAIDFGRALFGPIGGVVFAAMVAFSCFGALNGAYVRIATRLLYSPPRTLYAGSFFTSSRLIYVAGKEGYLPALFGRHNTFLKTPLNAMCLNAALTTMFILIGGGFRSLINFAVVASWAFYFLTVCKPS
ncbi:b(0,+)-type amino acid transporter 1 [Trametes pubescens]|uniref:B(0,+)-type amino acid transporter 1 n=1 Tax=Trametes pubescens TaxID=154538 RepID=A0A1M2W793_TRAPU|nr:b(0,+)-type amino acid transporter 1 [Trametes pubescens]